jgi:hypothetical protein
MRLAPAASARAANTGRHLPATLDARHGDAVARLHAAADTALAEAEGMAKRLRDAEAEVAELRRRLAAVEAILDRSEARQNGPGHHAVLVHHLRLAVRAPNGGRR